MCSSRSAAQRLSPIARRAPRASPSRMTRASNLKKLRPMKTRSRAMTSLWRRLLQAAKCWRNRYEVLWFNKNKIDCVVFRCFHQSNCFNFFAIDVEISAAKTTSPVYSQNAAYRSICSVNNSKEYTFNTAVDKGRKSQTAADAAFCGALNNTENTTIFKTR